MRLAEKLNTRVRLATSAKRMPVKVPSRVIVHPIVLLSVVDHFNRLRKIGNQRRVVGVLLGKWSANGVVDIATSYAGTWLLACLLTSPNTKHTIQSNLVLIVSSSI